MTFDNYIKSWTNKKYVNEIIVPITKDIHIIDPFIKSNEESFEYSSFTELFMPYGKMSGHYTFKDLVLGDIFKVEIPAFILTYPILLN